MSSRAQKERMSNVRICRIWRRKSKCATHRTNSQMKANKRHNSPFAVTRCFQSDDCFEAKSNGDDADDAADNNNTMTSSF